MKRKIDVKKILNAIKSFIITNKIFLIYIVISLIITSLLRLITIGWPLYFRAFLSDFLVILFIGSFSFLLKENKRFFYFLFWIIFISALSVGNTVYYEFYQSFISINLIGTASMIGQVNDALWAKIHVDQFVYLLFPIIFIVIHKYIKVDTFTNGKKIFRRILIVCVVLLLLIVNGFTGTDMSRFKKLWNRESVVQKYGIYFYTIDDLIQSVKPKLTTVIGYDKASYNFRNYYACKWENKKENNKYTNIFKGKNLLFIHGESIQNFLINLKINGKEVTPNLNKLINNSMYFSKFYPQISVGTSSDTEFTLNTGLMPSSSGTVFVNFYDRKYYGLPNYFKDMGYYTFSAHANNAEYWNRKAMHQNLGYMDFYAKDRFLIPSEDDPEYIGLGLSDKSFFNQLMPILSDIKANKSPFMGTIITLTNHTPFSDIEKYGEFDVTMDYTYIDENGVKTSGNANYLEGTQIGDYIKSSHYADEALGELFKSLDENGILDNTVVILYGDHEARMSKKDMNLLYNYNPEIDDVLTEEDEGYYNVYGYNYDLLKNTPLIIYSKDKKLKGNITKVMGMYDVLPTVANMFGFKEKFSLGHDIFDKNEGIVVFPNGNVLTDKVYYSQLNDEYITFKETPIEIDYINNLKETADQILEVSNGIVIHDLINKEESRIGECIHE